MHALFFHRSNDTLDHAVLLWAVRRDGLLLQSIAAYEGCIAAADKNQATTGLQQEGHRTTTERAKARDQRRLQYHRRRLGLVWSPQLPAQHFPGMAVDHQGDDCQTIASGPDSA